VFLGKNTVDPHILVFNEQRIINIGYRFECAMVFVKIYFPFNSVPHKGDISLKGKLTNASCEILEFFFLVPKAATLLCKCAFKELLVSLKVKLSSEIVNKLLDSLFALNGTVNG
jgi:hypothetical protein